MHPRAYLQLCGVLLVLVAIVGFLRPDMAGDFLRFDGVENWGHALIGLLLLVIAPLPKQKGRRWIAGIVGALFLLLALAGFLVSGRPAPNLLGITNLEHPVENVFHLLLGAWGVLAGLLNRTPIDV